MGDAMKRYTPRGRFVQHVIHANQTALESPEARLARETADAIEFIESGAPVCPHCGWDEFTGTSAICTKCLKHVLTAPDEDDEGERL